MHKVQSSKLSLLYALVPVNAGPPTVSDTKAAFLKAYPIPIPAIYNTYVPLASQSV